MDRMTNRPARPVSVPGFLLGVLLLGIVLTVAGIGWMRLLP